VRIKIAPNVMPNGTILISRQALFASAASAVIARRYSVVSNAALGNRHEIRFIKETPRFSRSCTSPLIAKHLSRNISSRAAVIRNLRHDYARWTLPRECADEFGA